MTRTEKEKELREENKELREEVSKLEGLYTYYKNLYDNRQLSQSEINSWNNNGGY